MNKKIVSSISAILLVLPTIALAALPPAPAIGGFAGSLTGFVAFVVDNIVIVILWSVAVAFIIVMFVIAGFKYLTAQGDPGKIAEANKAVIWGAAGTLVVIIGWSILSLVRVQLGV